MASREDSEIASERRKRTHANYRDNLKDILKPLAGGVLKRDRVVWFEDGNIVLQAGGVAFRVYQGFLAMHSEVFAGMFSVPQPKSAEQLDGSPVIHLVDHPDDLRHLLSALFINKSENLYVWARADVDKASPLMTHKRRDAIAAVNIGRLTGIASILPVALYMCCQLETEIIVNGFKRRDGRREQLAPKDIMRCLNARKTLVHDNVVSATRIFAPVTSGGCTSPKTCTVSLVDLLHGQVRYDGALNDYRCLEDWVPFLHFDNPNYLALCDDCQLLVQGRAADERERLWFRLPYTMGVEVDDWME
ncbi:uncharacterized protein C8Q71DRAFT_725214 [Rhodofomes roseus]|uniref:BTB domain-containing protein n=1 Tax=Rhodofomes roseus TaxID=34475 RepID=A0ABQ8K9N9_9APHY|nr:uncharacterized protein C8Q71DRAFT_725214 [Rhodofomes roseus]KAH9833977.1 hypothetical protein C8Q71DRAFT_725214 [Rhodofomes roseus]